MLIVEENEMGLLKGTGVVKKGDIVNCNWGRSKMTKYYVPNYWRYVIIETVS